MSLRIVFLISLIAQAPLAFATNDEAPGRDTAGRETRDATPGAPPAAPPATPPPATPPPAARTTRQPNAFDTNCGASPVDMRSIYASVPVADQTGTDTCAASTAAQLVDMYRVSHGNTSPNHHTSSLAAALAIESGFGSKSLSDLGRYPACKAITSILADPKVGSCDLSGDIHARPKTDPNWEDNNSTYLELFQNAYQQYERFKAETVSKVSGLSQFYAANREERKRLAGAIGTCLASLDVPPALIPPVDVIVDAFNESNPLNFSRDLYTFRCKDRKGPFDPGKNTRCGDARSNVRQVPALEVANRMHGLLDASPGRPLVIDYCDNMLQSTGATPDPQINRTTGEEHASCGKHSGLVIGQRKDPTTGKCQFLLRNTWGPKCGFYHEDWRAGCDNGSLWIDADILSTNMRQLSTVEPW